LAGKINGESVTNYVRKSRNWYDSWNEVIEKANK